MPVTQKVEPKAENTRPKPTPKPPKPKEETKPETFKFVSSLYMVNPFTQARFHPNEVTELTEVDSWTQAQIDAGILKPCP
jgi:hypothetical protein